MDKVKVCYIKSISERLKNVDEIINTLKDLNNISLLSYENNINTDKRQISKKLLDNCYFLENESNQIDELLYDFQKYIEDIYFLSLISCIFNIYDHIREMTNKSMAAGILIKSDCLDLFNESDFYKIRYNCILNNEFDTLKDLYDYEDEDDLPF